MFCVSSCLADALPPIIDMIANADMILLVLISLFTV